MNISVVAHLDIKYGEKAIIRTTKYDEFSVLKLDVPGHNLDLFIESHDTVNALMNALREIKEHIYERESEQTIESDIDLLDDFDRLPGNIQNILQSGDTNTDPYSECQRVEKELSKIGYYIDYDLSGELFGLRKMTKSELENRKEN